ncbi:tetratricopeptide repeat protein [Methylomarinum sp. Ch1-1]|uniref:Ancillary SecYEG translocon subunit n=1 Tax=Methylomarinum roseum TaxID=3067653 RepID=A0AAU7NUH2_9GAMM|nr:tetratricopeptide repeat protein [Methylomarinum sp. Ch1-1]MDP4519321.1 tetratricopeptide repeat protein [Methylomarinum sp. Ch1-1]
MEIYETEEQQVEALKRWWKTNGGSMIAGVVAALVLVGGWNFWRSYQQDKLNQASAQYQQLLEAAEQGKHQSVEKIAERLSEQYDSTPYSAFAGLMLAKSKVEQGDLEAAKASLQQLMQNADSDELKNVARIRLVRLMLATGDYEAGLKLIAEADPTATEGFGASYQELKGDLYVAMERLGEARTAYQSALRSGQGSPLLQFKLDDISAAEIVENPAP